jgi:hypothetical protein
MKGLIMSENENVKNETEIDLNVVATASLSEEIKAELLIDDPEEDKNE